MIESKTKAAFRAGWNAGRMKDEALEDHWMEFEIMQARRPTWRELAERLMVFLSILFLILYVLAPLLGWVVAKA